MTYAIRYSKDGGIYTTYSGVVTDEDFYNSVNERYGAERSIANYRYLFTDFSDVAELKISSNAAIEGAKRADIASNNNHDIIMVVVVPSDLEYGMARMWQAYFGDDTGWKVSLFRNEEQAHQWLDKTINNQEH